MRRILVTGGAGYIGSQTMRELSRAGLEPVCLDNFSTGHRELVGNHPLIEADLSDLPSVRRALQSSPFDAVIHFAARALVAESVRDPNLYYRSNVVNTLNLLQAMHESGVRDIVFSSTCAVYGEPAEVPIRESCPVAPVNPYGATKMIVERTLQDYRISHDFRFVALRYFNAAGADEDGTIGENHSPETHLIPRLLDVALGRIEAAEIYGTDYPTDDGTCVRDYVHVRDLAAAHVQACEYLRKNGESGVFNLGTGTGQSVLEVVSAVRRVTGVNIAARRLPRRAGDPPRLVADPQRAHTLLGWRAARSSLAEIVESAWRWHRSLRARSQ
jgi:UDP-glucose 4-epimerase